MGFVDITRLPPRVTSNQEEYDKYSTQLFDAANDKNCIQSF